jgi:imidazoleglycerol-phosphate dehydratase
VALARCVVEGAGRPYVGVSGEPEGQIYARIGGTEPLYAGSMTQHVIESLAFNADICVHLTLLAGREPHHIVEAEFKSLARALRFAVEPDPRVTGVPSTKGAL